MSTTVAGPAANTAAVAEMYAAFQHGDVPAVLEHLHPDITWNVKSHPDAAQAAGLPSMQPLHGRENIPAFFATLAAELDFHTFDVVTVTAADDRVVCEVVSDATHRPTGIRSTATAVHVWSFGDDGLARAYRVHIDTARALAGAGLGDAAQRNADTVQAIYAAFGRGDVPAILARLAPDVEWEVVEIPDAAHLAGVPWLTPRHGREAVAGFFASVAEHLEFHAFEPRVLAAAPDCVVTEAVLDVTPRAGGARERLRELHVFRFGPDGLVTGMEHVSDSAPHLRAAGLA